MATILQKTTSQLSTATNDMTGKQSHHIKEGIVTSNTDPIIACEALRQQNEALRQELHDIRREMDEITDQFRTEDAEEFKQLQAELEVAAKNCRILQFKLRKSEKRNENMEAEKAILEEKVQQIIRDNYRVRDMDEDLLIAKEVSVRLHNELVKSEESRMITEKLNGSLKQHLDTLKETLDRNLTKNTNEEYHAWQLSVSLYESLFREYILMEELAWLNERSPHSKSPGIVDGNAVSDLANSYQQKISFLNDEISNLKGDLHDRDKEISQLRIQYKILKQRSQSVDRSSTSSDDLGSSNRSRRGVSVEGGENLREQLDASFDEVRLLKNKLLRFEDDLNHSTVEKENLLAKLDEQDKQGMNEQVGQCLELFVEKIETLTLLIKENSSDEKIIDDLQQLLRSSRWSKQLNEDQSQSNITKTSSHTSEVLRQANALLSLFQDKHDTLEKIRYRLTNLTYDANDTCQLLEELDVTRKNLEDKQQLCQRLQKSVEASKKSEEQLHIQLNKNQSLEKILEQQKTVTTELQQENSRLSTLNARQLQDLKHLEQLRQSILTFEKKLDQKQTRVNELSMKIIEKEDIIETKVKECQKHRLELREIEAKYYTLGKQLEEQIIAMSKEMEKLNVEKEMLRFDLESLRLAKQNDRPSSSAQDEITRLKSQCRQQIIDSEIESYKLRLSQSNNEKDELLKTIKDLEKKSKDLQMKYDVTEQSWTRYKSDMSEKQRKYDESLKLKSEMQNAVDRLRQKLYDLEVHSQDKQNKHTVDKQQWEVQRLEFTGKINEFEEQLSKVTKRQRKDLETSWKKERTDLQKQLQQSQQTIKDLQKQIATREAPSHLTEKINVLMTENELLLNKIKELENIVDDIQLLKTEMQRLRDKNSSDWNYWRKQQSDLHAQLKQQQASKEHILNQFDRLQKQIKPGDDVHRFLRDMSGEPTSLNGSHLDIPTKTSLSNYSRETSADDIELSHGAVDDSASSPFTSNEKQQMFKPTYSAQENTAASLEEIAIKIDRVEDNLFSYRRFMDFIRAKSEKGSSVARDDSFTNIVSQASTETNNKRLASAPPENVNQSSQRRSRLDANINNSHEHLSSSSNEHPSSTDPLSSSALSPSTNSKNRFFSLSRRFRFRTQSPETNPSTAPASVHFLDEDIDLETKEPTVKKSDKPSRGILKTLRHRSPFRFRSKDAVIIEQEPAPPSPPPPPPPVAATSAPSSSKVKESKAKVLPPSSTKQRGRLVELKKPTIKPSSSSTNGTSRKLVNVTPIPDTTGSALVRRASGLKDLIHKFEATPTKPKRSTNDNVSTHSIETAQDDQISSDLPADDQRRTLTTKSNTIDIPDLLQNVQKDPSITVTRPLFRHSSSSRQTASFDSSVSMVSAAESITTTGSNTRKPTSTARPLMLSVNKEETS